MAMSWLAPSASSTSEVRVESPLAAHHAASTAAPSACAAWLWAKAAAKGTEGAGACTGGVEHADSTAHAARDRRRVARGAGPRLRQEEEVMGSIDYWPTSSVMCVI